ERPTSGWRRVFRLIVQDSRPRLLACQPASKPPRRNGWQTRSRRSARIGGAAAIGTGVAPEVLEGGGGIRSDIKRPLAGAGPASCPRTYDLFGESHVHYRQAAGRYRSVLAPCRRRNLAVARRLRRPPFSAARFRAAASCGRIEYFYVTVADK